MIKNYKKECEKLVKNECLDDVYINGKNLNYRLSTIRQFKTFKDMYYFLLGSTEIINKREVLKK